MISILWIAVVTALAVGVVLMRKYATKPPKAQKWEKAQIMKQLLAMSEHEAGASTIAPARSRTPAKPGARPVKFTPKPARTSQTDSFQQVGSSVGRAPSPAAFDPNSPETEFEALVTGNVMAKQEQLQKPRTGVSAPTVSFRICRRRGQDALGSSRRDAGATWSGATAGIRRGDASRSIR